MIFDEYDAWANLEGGGRNAARAAVARGQELFNTVEIPLRGVGGINDDFSVPSANGNCGVCHDTPHAGDHSVPAPLDIGDDSRFGLFVREGGQPRTLTEAEKSDLVAFLRTL